MTALLESTRVYGPIGADIGCAGVRLVQVVREYGALRVAQAAAWTAPLDISGDGDSDAPQQVSARLARLLRRPFRGREVVAALDVPQVELHLLDLPDKARDLDPQALASAAAWEVQRLTSLSGEGLVTASWPLPPARKAKTSLMGVAGARRNVQALVDKFTDVGLVCTRVDVAACALARLVWHLRRSPGSEVWAVLDVGASGSRLAICIEDVPVLVRRFEIGGAEWTQRLARHLGVSTSAAQRYKCDFGLPHAQPAAGPPGAEDALPQDADISQKLARVTAEVLGADLERLALETERSYEFVLQWDQQRVPGAMIMVGGGAQLPGLGGWLRGRLGVDVLPLSLVEAEDVARLEHGLSGIVPLEAAALACALSLQGLGQS